MIKILEAGYDLVLKVLEQDSGRLGFEYDDGSWKAVVAIDGESVTLTGYNLLFIFSLKTLDDQLLPPSDYYEDEVNLNIRESVKNNMFGAIEYEELEAGLKVVQEAWHRYEQDSNFEYKEGSWKASIHSFGSKPNSEESILLAGYGNLFMFKPYKYAKPILPDLESGKEFSGIIKLINQELIKKDSGFKKRGFLDTFWPRVFRLRIVLYNLARYLDVMSKDLISDNEKKILDTNFHDLKKVTSIFVPEKSVLYKVLRILDKNSNLKFSDTKKQLNIIKKYSSELYEYFSDNALIEPKEFKHTGAQLPLLYLINEPKDTVLAQMCIWTYRQCLKEKQINIEDYKQINEAIGFEVPILSEVQESELVEKIKDYVSQSLTKIIPKKDKSEYVNLATFLLLSNWDMPKSTGTFDAYIIKTAKGIFLDAKNQDNSYIPLLIFSN